MPNNPKSIALEYIRRSFIKVGQHADSPAKQRSNIHRIFEEKGWEVEWYEDAAQNPLRFQTFLTFAVLYRDIPPVKARHDFFGPVCRLARVVYSDDLAPRMLPKGFPVRICPVPQRVSPHHYANLG